MVERLCGSPMLLHILQRLEKNYGKIISSRMAVQQTDIGDREGGCLPLKAKVCVLSHMVTIASPS